MRSGGQAPVLARNKRQLQERRLEARRQERAGRGGAEARRECQREHEEGKVLARWRSEVWKELEDVGGALCLAIKP